MVQMRIEYAVGFIDGTIAGPFQSESEMHSQVQRLGTSFPLGRTVSDNGRVGPWKDNDPHHGLCYANPRYKEGYVYITPPSKEDLLNMFGG